MHWSHLTVSDLQELYHKSKYKKWGKAIEEGGINELSDELQALLRRLSSIMISEFEISPQDYEKIIKMMALAAMGGKTL